MLVKSVINWARRKIVVSHSLQVDYNTTLNSAMIKDFESLIHVGSLSEWYKVQ